MAINDEKDRFGDLLREGEKGREEQFFAERDRELLRKLRQKQQAGVEMTTPSAPERCPNCGELRRRLDDAGNPIAECPACGAPVALPPRYGGER